MKRILLAISFLLPTLAFALPIDWHGVFGVDSTLLDNYRRIEQTTDRSSNMTAGSNGTQEIPLATGNQANASWQSYLFRLNPELIVNDSATFKGEITSGYGRGGRLGDSSTQTHPDSVPASTNNKPSLGTALYPYNFSNSKSNLSLTKFYTELYADTATYRIGRHTEHYGLGAVVNSGEGIWDRHSYTRDGITVDFKLGNFRISPFWARPNTIGSLTRATKVNEYGTTLFYDNVERDLAFGLYYAKKESNADNSEIKSPTGTALGRTDVKLTDIYFRKSFSDLSIALEIPILSGELGSALSTKTKYKAKAILLESSYKINPNWKFNLFAGQVTGDDGNQGSFEAMYLNPNYQIANILFRYNLKAISTPASESIYDSYITNATYAKVSIDYISEKWDFSTALIWAKAEETAKAGTTSFNHMTNKSFTAVKNQADDLGTEIDLNFNYKWNREINIGGSFGYLLTGDYWAYTNDASIVNTADNSMAFQIRTSIDF